MVGYGCIAEREEGFELFHAAGQPPGKNDGGKIYGFHAEACPLRTLINSATMLTAISSGVSPPILMPMGECTRSSRSWGTPAVIRASYIAVRLRLLLIIPTYPAFVFNACSRTTRSYWCPRVTITMKESSSISNSS